MIVLYEDPTDLRHVHTPGSSHSSFDVEMVK
jgi:hypothetical protein